MVLYSSLRVHKSPLLLIILVKTRTMYRDLSSQNFPW